MEIMQLHVMAHGGFLTLPQLHTNPYKPTALNMTTLNNWNLGIYGWQLHLLDKYVHTSRKVA